MKDMWKFLIICWAVGFIMIFLQSIIDPLVMNNITFILKKNSAVSSEVFVYIGTFLFSTLMVCAGNTISSILKRSLIFSHNAKNSLKLISNILYTESDFMKKNTSEKIITRISRDVNDCSEFKVSIAIELPLIIIGAVTTCYMMFLGSPQFLISWGINLQHGNVFLASIIILMTPLHLTFLFFNNKFIKIEQSQAEAYENEIHLSTEALNAIDDIRASFAFSFILKRLNTVYRKTQKNKIKLFVLFSAFQNIGGLAWGITQIIVLGISAWLITRTNSNFKFEDYSGFCLLCGMFNQYISRCTDIVLNWQRAKPAQRRLLAFEQLPNRFNHQLVKKAFNSNSELIFKDVSCCISDRKILHNINLTLSFGQHVALVGPSGCGKSTLLKLLICHLEPNQGNIFYGKCNLKHINYQDYTSKIAYVSQHPFIFEGSIFDNITLGRVLDIPFQDIITLMYDVALVSDLIKMVLESPAVLVLNVPVEPNITLRKYLCIQYKDSKMNDERAIKIIENGPLLHPVIKFALSNQIGSAGKSISGGQTAKIALARALIGNPEILLLDEVTSSLDEISQEIIINMLTKKYKNKSVIFITHRLAAISGMERIIVMNSGEIVQDGTFYSLLQSKGILADLVARKTVK